MSKNLIDPDLPRHSEPQPGAIATMRTDEQGDVTISFSDGSEDLQMSRREFMRISGVAAATAAVAGAACREPIQEIVPYVDRPEEVRIGTNTVYASVCTACPTQCGMLVKTRAGRPFKLEGNPQHPVSRGALCARGQAHYLDLYDPDRVKNPLGLEGERRVNITWERLDTEVRNQLASVRRGGRLHILTGAVTGSANSALINEILEAFPNSRHYVYEPLSNEAAETAAEASYGSRSVPYYRFDRADVVVSLGADFLGTWLAPVEFTKQFASRRNPDEAMNRLIMFEGNLTLTGTNADMRYRVRPEDLVYIALGLAHEIVNVRNVRGFASSSLRNTLQPFSPDAVAGYIGGDVTADVLRRVANQLADAAGRSIVVAGGPSSQTPTGVSLEAAVNLLNAALGNDGQTIDRARPWRAQNGQLADLQALLAAADAGEVDMLIIDEANPVYSAPPELDVANRLRKATMIVSTSQRLDETAVLADFVAPGNHGMESWGDSMPREGVYAIQQPTIQPLYETRAFEESLLTWFAAANFVPNFQNFTAPVAAPTGPRPGAGPQHDAGAWYRYVRHHWENTIFPLAQSGIGFNEFWNATLRQGSFAPRGEAPAPVFRAAEAARLLPNALPQADTRNPGDLSRKSLQLFASVPLGDGRQANNGHLQELPDPVTKHTWGSYIAVSFRTFEAAGFKQGQIVNVRPAGSDVELPFQVLVLPGLHDDVVAIPLGYGRTRVGVVGNEVGQNGFRFSKASEHGALLGGIEVAITPTRRVERLSLYKGAGVVDLAQSPILPTTTLAEYREDPRAGVHISANDESLWPGHDYGDLKWAMAIDLSKCTGCSACTIACQEENNIPVVGRTGILEGREMHWLRIDRYYQLPPEAQESRQLLNDPMYHNYPIEAFGQFLETPRVLMQPMLCQHCDNAPCETVCPVLATMHSEDGLNQMAYNRCVGTRYCANNCPYKVRRYNWFNYSVDRSDTVFARLYPELKEHGRMNQADSITLSYNPDVTIRTRGVMEKCTFCVQRIRRGKWQLMKEGRRLFRDGEVTTACQDACPADAIVFGNQLDPEHRVARAHKSPRAMFSLSDLGTRSAIAYLTDVWNTEEPQA